MSDYIFLFDLDATVTKLEILPELATRVGRYEEMTSLTERTMLGELPFKSSFLERVELLKSIPIAEIQDIIYEIPVHERIAKFISNNRERCYIVTGNLNVWIMTLLQKLNMLERCFCSTASIEDGRLKQVQSVLDKSLVARSFVMPFVSVGDGSNDAELAREAAIGIGFGGVRPIAYSLLCNCNYAIYDEDRLCWMLNRLL